MYSLLNFIVSHVVALVDCNQRAEPQQIYGTGGGEYRLVSHSDQASCKRACEESSLPHCVAWEYVDAFRVACYHYSKAATEFEVSAHTTEMYAERLCVTAADPPV